MNQVGEIAVKGRVLFTDWCGLTYAKQPERWKYQARVVLVSYGVDRSVETPVDTCFVPEPYLLSLRLLADVDADFAAVVDSTLMLDAAQNDSHAIRMAISRFDEMVRHADEAIAEWRAEQGLDKQEAINVQ